MFEATRPISTRPRPDAIRPRPRPNNLASRPHRPRGLNIPATITFPLPLILQDTAWYDILSLTRGRHRTSQQCNGLSRVCTLWEQPVVVAIVITNLVSDGADSVHRWLDESRHGALRDGATERVVDGVGPDTRRSGLRQHQLATDRPFIRLLPSVLDAARPTTALRRVAPAAAQNVRVYFSANFDVKETVCCLVVWGVRMCEGSSTWITTINAALHAVQKLSASWVG